MSSENRPDTEVGTENLAQRHKLNQPNQTKQISVIS